jgi:mRNA interferase MazF
MESTDPRATDPRRGEIWLASLGAARRGEPGKNRPVVVLSANEILTGESHELIAVVPLSTSLPRSALRPQLDPETGIDSPSAAVCRALRGIARSRLLRPVGTVPPQKMQEIERALGLVLGLA